MHDAMIKKNNSYTSFVSFWPVGELSVAGARAYSAGEVARAGYLFRFVRQSAIAHSVPVTRSLPSA